MAQTLPPNSELVAVAYIRSLGIGPSATSGVGTTLPENTASWSDGFVQVLVVGGSPNIDVPTRRPLIQVDCWVPSINSSKPQWGKASTLAETISNSVYGFNHNGVKLSLGGSFQNARVQAVYLASEPRRINNDPAGHARYTFDLALTWVTDNQ